MNNLSIMFADLAKLDPETWHDISKRILFIGKHPELEIIKKAIIQDALQRACEERGWSWTVRTSSTYRYFGVISKSIIGDVEIAKHGDSPALALLAAYIEALRYT